MLTGTPDKHFTLTFERSQEDNFYFSIVQLA